MAIKRKAKFRVDQVVMEKYNDGDFWKVGQISKIVGTDYHMTDGRVRRAKQLRPLTAHERGEKGKSQ